MGFGIYGQVMKRIGNFGHKLGKDFGKRWGSTQPPNFSGSTPWSLLARIPAISSNRPDITTISWSLAEFDYGKYTGTFLVRFGSIRGSSGFVIVIFWVDNVSSKCEPWLNLVNSS